MTKTRLDMLREADAIVVAEIKQAGLYRQTAQAFAVLLPVQSVGVMGDARTYADVVAVRSVDTEDFMTADWSHLPYELLARISTRIINEVQGREPRGVRHQQQAAGDDRVGVGGTGYGLSIRTWEYDKIEDDLETTQLARNRNGHRCECDLSERRIRSDNRPVTFPKTRKFRLSCKGHPSTPNPAAGSRRSERDPP